MSVIYRLAVLRNSFKIISIQMIVGKPIQCWIPQEFTRGWEEYAENYCWVSNTYFSPLPKRLPQNMTDRESARILYYQWAPILMAIQALLFYLPCLIWRLFYSHSGFNVRRIMQMANDSNILLPEHGLKNVRFIARYMEGCIYRLRDYKRVLGTSAASAFPYRGMQRFPIETELPPPGYTKSEGESRRSGGEKRSNGEPNLGVPSSRRHKRVTSSFCGGSGLGSCWNSRSSRRRARKFPLNPITESSPAAGLASPVERADMARRLAKSNSKRMVCCGRRSGNFLVVLYFIVKGLYLINIVGQLVLMEKFIGTNTAFYGVRVLIDLLQGTDWHTSGNFPRVTFCDFEAKKLGKNQLYTIQCVLPLNMFLEKIFIFLWFWHCALGIITLISFINWFMRMGFARYRLKFIRRYLKIMCVMKDTDRSASKKFVENFLRPDGIFLIRLISMNVGDMMAGDLACELWHIYRHKRTQDVVQTGEMKYIEPIPNYLGHPQSQVVRHHPEIGFIAASAPPRSIGTASAAGNGEKVMLNGDDSIV
ncbi:unnamed protein product [Rodentolepis nana]|uniref:Innexin n=1 Tax=Rodentolepis nana TaxID=102285 RepID=A0A158QH74_RODNA|nr:unnamed protein product [Rodentolepis nana]